jgi:hypothetical protein
MAKVPGFAKAFAGRWRIAAGFSGKGTTRMTPPAVADQASFAHAAEFFNSLLVLLSQSVAAFCREESYI